jgi:hypothetical protein
MQHPTTEAPVFRFFKIHGEKNTAAVYTNEGLFGDNKSRWTGANATDLVISDAARVISDAARVNTAPGHIYEAMVPTFDHENSGVSMGAIHEEHLGEEITEEEAREIHPRMIERLELADIL